jgi:hypothetical protein
MIVNMRIEAIENEIRRMFQFVVAQLVKCKLLWVAELMKLVNIGVTMKQIPESESYSDDSGTDDVKDNGEAGTDDETL